jgi:pilus assembly protein CpaE
VDEVLARYGFEAAERVPTSSVALQLARESRVDLVMLPVEGDLVDFDVLASQIARGQTLVVGTASTPAPDLILRAMRAGVHEFLLSPINGAEFASAVERLMRRMQSDTGDRLLVAVHSPKGGLGTTSVAINLAHQFAARTPGGKAGLADFVVGGGDVGVMLNLRPTFDVGDLALKIDQLDAALLDSVLVNAPGGVRVLAASDRPETAEHVDAQAAVAILGQMRAGFFYTVVDCEHHLSDRTLAAMDAADRVVLVTQLNVAALRSTQRAITVCRRLGFGEDKLVVVANRYQPTDLISAEDAARVLDHPIASRVPNDYRTSEAALTRGVPVSAHAPDSPLAKAFAELASLLIGNKQPSAADTRHTRTNGQSSRLGRLLGIGRK